MFFLRFLSGQLSPVIIIFAFLFGGLPSQAAATGEPLALYTFSAGGGDVVYDRSTSGSPLNLKIKKPTNVQWLKDGGLAVVRPTIIKSSSAATKLSNAIKKSNAFTLEAWVRPDKPDQTGPARIATLSDGTAHRNLTLGQSGSVYDMRLRTTNTNQNGLPSFQSDQDSAVVALTHVVMTRASNGVSKLYVNGIKQDRRDDGSNLTGWNNKYLFALANELSENRAWTGTYYSVAIYDYALPQKEVTTRYTAGVDSSPQQPDSTQNASTDTQSTSSDSSSGGNTQSSSSGADTTPDSNTASNSAQSTVSINWTAPTTRTDGNSLSLSDIAGYRIYLKNASLNEIGRIYLSDPSVNSYTIEWLGTGEYYIALTVIDTDGNESSISNVVKRTVM